MAGHPLRRERVGGGAHHGSGKTLCAFLSAIDRLMTKEGDDLLRTSGGGDGTAESIAMPRNVNPSAASGSCIFRH